MAQRIKEKIELSVEQRAFIDKAKEGANILP